MVATKVQQASANVGGAVPASANGRSWALRLPVPHLTLEYLVVDLALPGIGKDGVGVTNFLECRVRRGLAARVAVRVPLHRRAAIGALDLVRGGVRLHAEGRIEGGHGGW